MHTTIMDWTITQRNMWVATHTDGTQLVARTRASLNTKINLDDVRRRFSQSEAIDRELLALNANLKGWS